MTDMSTISDKSNASATDHVNAGPDPAFEAWVASLPPKSWAKYDLSACRLGWDAALSALTPDALAPIPAGEVAEMVERLLERAGSPVHHWEDWAIRSEMVMRQAADLLSRMAGETWQPIQTAPRDGTEILCGDFSGNMGDDFQQVVSWENRSYDNGTDSEGWAICDGPMRPPSVFTHWQPLPQAPK